MSLDKGNLAQWGALGALALGAAVGYGSLQSRVEAHEKQLQDSKPIAERLATLEANQKNTESAVNLQSGKIENLTAATTALLIELRTTRPEPRR